MAQTLSRLERLAPELRAMIWTYCLVSPTKYLTPWQWGTSTTPPYYFLSSYDPATEKSTNDHNICTSLLRVNKNIAAETSPMFWGQNTIHFRNATAMKDLVEKCGKEALKKMQGLSLVLHYGFGDEIFANDAMEFVFENLARIVKASAEPEESKSVFEAGSESEADTETESGSEITKAGNLVLRKLEIELNPFLLSTLVRGLFFPSRTGSPTFSQECLHDLLPVLQKFKDARCGEEGVALKRSISVYREVDSWLDYQQFMKKYVVRTDVKKYQVVLEELHGALGGEVTWDQDTIWRGGERVAEIWEFEEV